MTIGKVAVYIVSAILSFWLGMQAGFLGIGRIQLPSSISTARVSNDYLVGCAKFDFGEEEQEIPCPKLRDEPADYCDTELHLPVLHKSLGESTAVQVFPLLHHPVTIFHTYLAFLRP